MAKGKTLAELQAEVIKRTEIILGAWTTIIVKGKEVANPTGITKKITNKYGDAFKDIKKIIDAFYIRVLSGKDPKKYLAAANKNKGLKKLNTSVTKTYSDSAVAAGALQIEAGKIAINNVYYGNMAAVNTFTGSVGKGYFVKLDPDIERLSVIGTKDVWDDILDKKKKELSPWKPRHGSLLKTLNDNKNKDIKKLIKAIRIAIKKGKSADELAKDIQKILNTSASNAIRIARTEGIRNMNGGAYANTKAAMDEGIDLQRMVVETPDSRIRSQSAQIDGQIVDGDEPFNYPGGLKVYIIGNSGVAAYDINERGTSIDIVEGFEPETRSIKDEDGKSQLVAYRNVQKWIEENGLKFNAQGRLVAI